jgi:hypothetical protein
MLPLLLIIKFDTVVLPNATRSAPANPDPASTTLKPPEVAPKLGVNDVNCGLYEYRTPDGLAAPETDTITVAPPIVSPAGMLASAMAVAVGAVREKIGAAWPPIVTVLALASVLNPVP